MNWTIKKLVIATSSGLAIGLLCAVATNSLALFQLRVGGPLYLNLKQDFDLLADILPPPAYIIEPYLEATLALREGKSGAHRQQLGVLRKSYDERKAYWLDQRLDGDTKALFVDAARKADAFWNLLDEGFLPALQRGDRAATDRAYSELSQRYMLHRIAVDKLVAKGNANLIAAQKKADGDTTLYTLAVLAFSGVTLMFLAASIMGAIGHVVRPLARFTHATTQLSRGDHSVDIPLLGQKNELGVLAGAMAEFRDKLVAAERSKSEQAEIIVSSIGDGLDHLAKGDLTHRIAANLTGPFVKLKDDFNLAMGRLQDTIKQVLGTTGQIAIGAGEISQAADDLSRRTEQQAASLEETSAALEEITGTVKKTSANTKQVNSAMASARVAAENGGQVVETATQAMDAISQSSKKITDIIGVIDEIAFQTNLLALNAGVEAARAGDAGRGFAVVASEVRALAQRSSEAAKQIKVLITASGDQVADGVKYVGATGEALHHIVDQVQQINAIVSEMAQAAEQEATGIEQVNAAVGQMDQVTQQNAAMVEESTAASRTLADETQHLQSLVRFFDVGEDVVVAQPKRVSKPLPQQTMRPRRVATAGKSAPAVRPTSDEWSDF